MVPLVILVLLSFCGSSASSFLCVISPGDGDRKVASHPSNLSGLRTEFRLVNGPPLVDSDADDENTQVFHLYSSLQALLDPSLSSCSWVLLAPPASFLNLEALAARLRCFSPSSPLFLGRLAGRLTPVFPYFLGSAVPTPVLSAGLLFSRGSLDKLRGISEEEAHEPSLRGKGELCSAQLLFQLLERSLKEVPGRSSSSVTSSVDVGHSAVDYTFSLCLAIASGKSIVFENFANHIHHFIVEKAKGGEGEREGEPPTKSSLGVLEKVIYRATFGGPCVLIAHPFPSKEETLRYLQLKFTAVFRKLNSYKETSFSFIFKFFKNEIYYSFLRFLGTNCEENVFFNNFLEKYESAESSLLEYSRLSADLKTFETQQYFSDQIRENLQKCETLKKSKKTESIKENVVFDKNLLSRLNLRKNILFEKLKIVKSLKSFFSTSFYKSFFFALKSAPEYVEHLFVVLSPPGGGTSWLFRQLKDSRKSVENSAKQAHSSPFPPSKVFFEADLLHPFCNEILKTELKMANFGAAEDASNVLIFQNMVDMLGKKKKEKVEFLKSQFSFLLDLLGAQLVDINAFMLLHRRKGIRKADSYRNYDPSTPRKPVTLVTKEVLNIPAVLSLSSLLPSFSSLLPLFRAKSLTFPSLSPPCRTCFFDALHEAWGAEIEGREEGEGGGGEEEEKEDGLEQVLREESVSEFRSLEAGTSASHFFMHDFLWRLIFSKTGKSGAIDYEKVVLLSRDRLFEYLSERFEKTSFCKVIDCYLFSENLLKSRNSADWLRKRFRNHFLFLKAQAQH